LGPKGNFFVDGQKATSPIVSKKNYWCSKMTEDVINKHSSNSTSLL